jgi:hypothetical protein
MNSFITLIVDQKTSHLRELVVNQKTKRQRPKRNTSTLRSSNNHMPKCSNYRSRYNNNHRNEYTTPIRSEFNTSRNEYSTSRNEYSTSRNEYSTSRNEYSTPRNEYSTSRNEYSTPRNDYSTPRKEYSTPRSDTSARGYDHVKIKSFNSKPKGTVTTNLRSSIENLCNTSEVSFFTTLPIIIFL